MSAHQIQLAIREAAAHERTASKAEDTYTMKMKAAGASMFAAFKLAAAEAPDLKGRKLDDKAISRIYASTKARPWWDKHLAAVQVEGKPATREWGTRLIQWHLDPDAALSRRAQHALGMAAARKRVSQQRTSAARGARVIHEPVSRTEERRLDHHAARITAATTTAVVAGRELPRHDENAAERAVTLEDLLGERNRIDAAIRKISAEDRAAALETLRVTARELEELVK